MANNEEFKLYSETMVQEINKDGLRLISKKKKSLLSIKKAQVIYAKKLSHHFLLHFPIGMGSYGHHAKYQGVFP